MKQSLWLLPLLLYSACSNARNIDNLMSLSLEELTQVKVTGATLTALSQRSVPSATTVLTASEISKLGVDNLGELMNLVPGFQSYRSSGSALHYPFSARGRRIGLNSAEVLIMIDGQRIEEPGTSGSALVAPLIPVQNIERVEFIRGPGAAIYGSNAMMGVVNIVTRNDVDKATFASGSHHRRQGILQSSERIQSVSANIFAYADQDDGEFYDVAHRFDPDLHGIEDPRLVHTYNLKLAGTTTRLNLQHYQAAADGYLNESDANEINAHRSERDGASLEHDFCWQNVESTLQAHYSHSRFEPTTQVSAAGDFSTISDPPSDAPQIISFDVEGYSEYRMQWNNNWTLNSSQNLQFGSEFRHIKAPVIYVQSNYDTSDLYQLLSATTTVQYYAELVEADVFQEESRRDILGIYGQYQHLLSDQFEFFLGARYDHFSSIDFRISPRAGLIHHLNKHQTLKLLYGEAFRAPAESELNIVRNGSLSGNPELTPETVRTWDLIWLGEWDTVRFSAGYFESHFNDPIGFTPTGIGTEYQYINTEQDPISGFELEGTLQPSSKWWIRATYTRLTEMTTLSFREAETMASFIINYMGSRWNLNVSAIYNGERDMLTSTSAAPLTLEAYTDFNLKYSYSLAHNWLIYLQGKNITNRNYLTPPINNVYSDGLPTRGRELLTGLEWDF